MRRVSRGFRRNSVEDTWRQTEADKKLGTDYVFRDDVGMTTTLAAEVCEFAF